MKEAITPFNNVPSDMSDDEELEDDILDDLP